MSGVKPRRAFSTNTPLAGAWEFAARYSYLDLSDENVDGGTMSNFSFGLNWYLTESTRIMTNFVNADIDATDQAGRLYVVQTRLQFEF